MKLSFLSTILISSLYVAQGQRVRRRARSQQEPKDTVEKNVLLKLSLSDDSEVKFMEPIQGVVVAAATAKGEAVDLLEKYKGETDIAKLYKALSGQKTVPSQLEAALDRSRSQLHGAAARSSSPPPPKVAKGKDAHELTTSKAKDNGHGRRMLDSYYYTDLSDNYYFGPAFAYYYTYHDVYVTGGTSGVRQASYVYDGSSYVEVASQWVYDYGYIWTESYGYDWVFEVDYGSNDYYNWYIEYA